MADAIVLIDDLFFQAKLHQDGEVDGRDAETVATGEQLLKSAAASPSALIIVDLNARQGALEAVEQLGTLGNSGKRRQPAEGDCVSISCANRIGGEARAAGCQEVMPRSQFTQNLAAILRGAKS